MLESKTAAQNKASSLLNAIVFSDFFFFFTLNNIAH